MRSLPADPRVYAVVTGQPQAVIAQELTVTKARVEVPVLRTVDLGVDPGKLPDDTTLWATIGARMLDRPYVATAAGTPAVLSPESRALVDELLTAGGPGVDAPNDAARAAIVARFEESVLADTALNEAVLRTTIRSWFVAQLVGNRTVSFTELNRWVYDGVFHTPATDPWLGLLPSMTFTGLPAGAMLTRADAS